MVLTDTYIFEESAGESRNTAVAPNKAKKRTKYDRNKAEKRSKHKQAAIPKKVFTGNEADGK